ncbi:hypothetical protein HZY91_00595 [Facklamia sp. DSM 111018]|uniref:Uncharacterized protein n=1 Tax=Facklamia lactis TaxID=2749967 RepID=A0ABS0LMN0_9LACT|nr:hypothetical protein [Facklamia lactis]MBG9979933.1 hypothetical protein [Facklamia lactis]MBG9985387.1 hypothetical protein [Facklamia lactis]
MKKFISVVFTLILITTFTNVLDINAEESNSEANSSDQVMDETSSRAKSRDNILDLDSIEANGPASLVSRDGNLILSIDNENGGLLIEAEGLETETSYILGFTYEVIDGKLLSFGAHTDGIWADNYVVLNGEKRGEFADEDSAYSDKEGKNVVEVFFTTPKDKSEKSRLIIQPNRSEFDEVAIELSDLYIVEEVE